MIVSSYISRELIKSSSFILFGLISLYLSLRFSNSLSQAADGAIATSHIFQIVSLKMLTSMKDLVPISLFLGVFVTIAKFQQSFEWNAMRSIGFSQEKLLVAIIKVSIIGAIFVAFFSLVASPEAELRLRKIKQETENEATISGVRAGKFINLKNNSHVFYAESSNRSNGYLTDTFVERNIKNRPDIMRSQKSYIEIQRRTGDRFVVFEKGINHQGVPGKLNFITTEFDRYLFRMQSFEPLKLYSSAGFLPTQQLLNSTNAFHKVEFQWRLAPILCTILFPLLSCILLTKFYKGSWHLRLLVLISSYFIYNNTLGAGRALMRKGSMNPEIGLWPLHLAFTTLIVLLVVSSFSVRRQGSFFGSNKYIK